MPFVTVRDIQMYYEIRGAGVRLLYIGGTGGDLRRKPSIIFDSPIAAYFKILAYDQRGLGQTDRPDIPYSMMDYAMDADSLLSTVGWDSCLVMGLSFGGMVAQEFALRYPKRVERLVLCCTSSGGVGGSSYPIEEFDDLSPRERAMCLLPIADTRLDAAWQATNPQRFQQLVEQRMASSKVGVDERNRKVGVRRQLEARASHDTYNRLPNLRMPVFICGGRYDGVAPISNQEVMHKQIPNSRLELFEGGHHFILEDPRAFVRIAAFLRSELDEWLQ
ncbi:alpha/beta fold hydrolase [Chloroflexota bacterium]